MKRMIWARFENGVFRPLDPEDLPIPEGSIITVPIDDEPNVNDTGWMKQLLDDEEAEHYLRSVGRDTAA